MLALLALLAPAQAVEFSLFGSCPGVTAFTIDEISPGAAVAIISGRVGDSLLPSGPCRGLEVGLSEVRVLTRLVDRDLDGVIAFDRILGPGTCGAPLQIVDMTVCEASSTVRELGVVDVDCPTDWLVGTPCNGVDYGGGCTPEETGYHYNGIYDDGVQNYACWWHTKNQAWNTDTSTNFYALAEHFGITPGIGGSRWCHPRDGDPCAAGTCAAEPGGYFDSGDVGAWGWCGDAPFMSGGHVCLPVDDELAELCR